MISFKQFLESKKMQRYYDGSISLYGMYFQELPKELKDLIVSGDFFCNNNQLTTLENSPKEVGGDFWCGPNQLTSLEGAPKKIGGSFFCYSNQLTSLEGVPTEIGESFNCCFNELTSLEYAPTKVGEHFICNSNLVEFTEEYVRSVCTVKGNVYV